MSSDDKDIYMMVRTKMLLAIVNDFVLLLGTVMEKRSNSMLLFYCSSLYFSFSLLGEYVAIKWQRNDDIIDTT